MTQELPFFSSHLCDSNKKIYLWMIPPPTHAIDAFEWTFNIPPVVKFTKTFLRQILFFFTTWRQFSVRQSNISFFFVFFCTSVPKQLVNISYAKSMELFTCSLKKVHFICICRTHQFYLCSNTLVFNFDRFLSVLEKTQLLLVLTFNTK